MSSAIGEDIWRKCSICRTGIGFGRDYYLCSVSTCNRKRIGLFFCSLPCFEAHLPGARHRDAWAEPARAPSEAEWRAAQSTGDAAEGGTTDVRVGDPPARAHDPERRVIVRGARSAPSDTSGVSEDAPGHSGDASEGDSGPAEHEILVVVSKLKKYVRDASGMNTSDGVMPVLSDHLRELCRRAIRHAAQDGRRTVLDRDFVKIIAAETRSPSGSQRGGQF